MRKEHRDDPGPQYRHPLYSFQKLMPHRVRRLLLVASRYDSFLLGEDDRLNHLILSEFLDLNLGARPWLTRVASGDKALSAAKNRQFNMLLMTPHIRDMDVVTLTQRVQEVRPQLPIVPLAFDRRELDLFRRHPDLFPKPYVWQGDDRLLLAILQATEDRWNVEHDTARVGVSVVILIEDNEHYYSSFLPMLYSELREQSQSVVSEGFNLQNQVMRLRARPKILHCTTFEEAEHYYHRYKRHLLGLISDVSFPRGGRHHAEAGLEFAHMVREDNPDLPILLQTTDAGFGARAAEVQARILLKHSRLLLHHLSDYIREHFGFGDFVFRMPDGKVIDQVSDVQGLRDVVREIPDESILQHAQKNHFSTWLRARTEFGLAERLRGFKAEEFESATELKEFIQVKLDDFLRDRQGIAVTRFLPGQFWSQTTLARIGDGSLGGKARGLAFVRTLLSNYRVRRRFKGLEVAVPGGVVLATDVFDAFVNSNGLVDFALEEEDDAKIEARFLEARFPEPVFSQLKEFLAQVDMPIAVRSSSLLEDSQYFPFTGVYQTIMVPNHDPDPQVRLKQLVNAIKRVYASTYSHRVKEYIEPSPYRLEEEKMAVILQCLAGRKHDAYFYPDFSGVARSHNFYPVAPAKAEDGIVTVALGLGEMVVEGGKSVSFAPPYPDKPVHFGTTDEIVRNAQRRFYAIDLGVDDPDVAMELVPLDVEKAHEHGVLGPIGSIYSHENRAVYDGLGRRGIPLVTFAPILKQRTIPLPEVCALLLAIGSRSMNRPVEIEFAVNVARNKGERTQFAFLQMRPFVLNLSDVEVKLDDYRTEDLIVSSSMILGSGRDSTVQDLIVVDREAFDRSGSREAAQKVARFNALLNQAHTPYALIGVGRWGASDPWLGIPVLWEQINGARVIVESDLRDIAVAPSQGSHFFQNLTTSDVGYFTVGTGPKPGFVNWEWLKEQEPVATDGAVRHLRLDRPMEIVMDGRNGTGVILKPRPPAEEA